MSFHSNSALRVGLSLGLLVLIVLTLGGVPSGSIRAQSPSQSDTPQAVLHISAGWSVGGEAVPIGTRDRNTVRPLIQLLETPRQRPIGETAYQFSSSSYVTKRSDALRNGGYDVSFTTQVATHQEPVACTRMILRTLISMTYPITGPHSNDAGQSTAHINPGGSPNKMKEGAR